MCIKKTGGVLIFILILGCVKDSNFDAPKQDCATDLEANLSFAELESLVTDETSQIYEDWVVEGYVTSSDEAGNFFNELYVQNHPTSPTQTIQIEMDLRESHLVFEQGSKILIKLKGLYMGKSGDMVKLGGTFSAFGNVSVGRLPTLKIPEHLFSICENENILRPMITTIPKLDSLALGTLIRLDSLEVLEEELGNTFADKEIDTERRLKDCEENIIILLSSGYSDFQAEMLPEGNGPITGILQKDGKDYQLIIRDLSDIDFTNERCPEVITEFTSTNIFISELADPDNNSGARFVELYNASNEPLDLNLWTLRRYTNANIEVGSTIDLSGQIIAANSTLVISPNASEFELVFGFPPDLGVSTNSPADSNGDDNLELVDPFETIIDVFGIVGEDGSKTNHEFEDGRALRNPNITEGNPTYSFEEWTIFNDTGDAGTTKLPQNAPEDFTPGVRD